MGESNLRTIVSEGVYHRWVRIPMLICFFLISPMVASFAHGVQVVYCVTTDGTIRVFIEHWHGNITTAQTADGAQVQIIVDDGTTVTNDFYPAQGVVWDTTVDNLPGCKEAVVFLSGCTNASGGRNMNTQNDWVYWDFTPPQCGTDLTITVNAVQGPASWYFDEGCSNLYPTSFTASFDDCAPPVVECVANLISQVDAGNCTAEITSGLEPNILFDDCTPTDDLIVTYDITGATVRSGNGFANGIFNKGISTITYSVEDNTGKVTTCSFDVEVVDTNGPINMCPSNLSLECGDANNSSIINTWLSSLSATDGCGVMSISNNYDPFGFSYQEEIQDGFIGPVMNKLSTGLLSSSLINSNDLLSLVKDCQYQSDLFIEERSGTNLYDFPYQLKLDHKAGMSQNFDDLLILDSDNRVVPYWVESHSNKSALIWIKIPELEAYKTEKLSIQYGGCLSNPFEYTDVFNKVLDKDKIEWDEIEEASRVLAKFQPASGKQNIYFKGEYSKYKVSLGAGKDGQISSQLIRLKESEMPWPLFTEANVSNSESYFLDFQRDGLTKTTQHQIRNDRGAQIISDKFVDDGFGNLKAIEVHENAEIEFIALMSSVSQLPVATSELTESIGEIELREFELLKSVGSGKYQNNQKMMGCDCTVTQGAQSFTINAIQNAEDDVAFYAYGNPAGASSNTGLELSEEVVLFLYENTLTGEISLFILIDIAGDPTGGNGTIDFFCLPTSATLDFSDDPGEITGIFPTVTANWRWAPCCTDGALIGNVGCNTTFDFFANFPAGIDGISWVSGTLAAPVYNSFNSGTDPVRITCGDGQPECCQNSNVVNITNATCPTSTDGAIDVIVDPGGAPYTFLWSNGATTEDLSGLGVGTYTVTITDKDNCEQIIDNEVESEETPELSCPTNVTVSMTGTTATVDLSDLGYTINYPCPDNVTETCTGCGSFDCSDQNMIEIVTVTVEDVLGNTDECMINVLIENLPPDITCPSDLNLECADPSNSTLINDWLSTVTATDAEGNVVSLVDNFDPLAYSLIDDNIFDAFQMKSSGKQSIEGPKDFYYILESVNKTTRSFMMPDPLKGSQVVTFTATDECGNTSTCTATITISDTTPPALTCPEDITLECGDPNNDAIVTNWLATATYFDACNATGLLTNNYGGTPTGGCGPGTGSETVTFTADDECGNTSTCTATLVLEDNEVPEFLMKPQDLIAECINANGNTPELNAWLATNGGGMAGDQCDPSVTWTATAGTEVDECGYTRTIPYTFTITDDCGNTATAEADFIVIDETPPTLTLRADVTVNCGPTNDDQLAGFLANRAIVSDVCDDNAAIDVTSTLFNTIPGCGNTKTEIYLFTATDDCGNESTALWNFTIQDIVRPTWSSPPGTLFLECGDLDNPNLIASWIDDVEASMTDACGGPLMITNDWDGNLTDGCNQNTTVTFTVTDECGNFRDDLSRTIAVRDNINPTIINCPSDMTVNVDAGSCDANIIFSTPVGFDQCTDPVTVIQLSGPNSGSTFPIGTSTIVFEAMDACGRRSNPDCSFDITVIDSVTPTINCPTEVIKCADAGSCTWTSDASIDPVSNENCSGQSITYDITGVTTTSGSNSAAGTTFAFGTSTVCYTITDAASNSSSCCFDVIVEDCEAPQITCPMDATFECDGAGNTTDINDWLTGVSATDLCDASPDVSNLLFNSISDCGGSEIQVHEFTALDDNNNSVTCLANVTIEDTTDPVIDTDAVNDLVECNSATNAADLFAWLNSQADAMASDDCSPLTWSHDFDGLDPACGETSAVTVQFLVTDDCGNTATTSADFTIQDTEDPVITCPEDLVVECGDGTEDAVRELWLNSATAVDGCGDVEITNDDPGTTTFACGTVGSTIIVFTATDECGNSATCAATISVEDNVGPRFIVRPVDMTVECDGGGNAAALAAWLSSNGGASVSDDCNASVTWNNTSAANTANCGSTSEASYLFTVTDACMNSSTAIATFTIEDTTPPSLTLPTDTTVECDGSGNTGDLTGWLSTVSGSDNCSTPVVFSSVVYNTISDCGGGYTETYLFTVTDDCGNETTGLANFTIEDTAVPTISCPSNLTLECGADQNPTLILNWLTTATIDDASSCSEVVLTNDYDGSLPPNCGGMLPVEFTVTDDCGNTSNCTASIILDDVTSPDFVSCPLDMTINVDVSNCGANPIFSTPQIVDNCGVSVAQTAGPASGTTFPVGTSAIEFTATDECGNTEVCQYNITVFDSAIPDIDCPADITTCVDAACMWNSTNIAPNTGNDNCTGYTITYDITGTTTASGNDDATGTVFNLGASMVCYTIEDASANTAQCCFDITVIDCEAPVITCPADQTVECDGLGNAVALATFLGGSSAIDNCNDDAVLANSEVNTISDCGSSEIKEYEFTAIDDSGNLSSCLAKFTIEDTTDPSVDTDASDLTVECNGAGNTDALVAWLNSNGGAVASDDCGDVTWSHDFDMALTLTCGLTGSQLVTFTATDACGNTAQTSATFTIEDTVDPVAICPQSILMECGNPANDAIIANWLGNAEGTDECSNVTVTNNYPDVSMVTCGNAETFTVTFTATDDCDNTSTCVRTVTILDTNNPTIDLHASDLVLECADPGNAAAITAWVNMNGGATATDDCDANLTWTATALTAIAGCGMTETIPYIFRVTDDCGNESITTANVITEDTTLPVVTPPSNMTVECDGAGNLTALNTWLADVTATDDCSTPTTDNLLFNTISACGSGSEMVFQFSATDDCGNVSTALASFIIEDTSMPTITCPSNLELECGNPDNDQLILEWLDSASGNDPNACSNISFSHNYPGGLPNPLTCNGGTGIEITFTVEDECTNTSSCTASILMDDTIEPYFINCHDDVTLSADPNSCERNVLYSLPIAFDQCDDEVDVTMTAGLASGSMFPVGTTTVTYLATDDCGNTFECSFDITIEDGELPTLECPSNDVIKCNDAGVCVWTADDDVDALNSDFCGVMTLTYNITGATTISSAPTGENYISSDGVQFELGTSTVTYTIEDESGNTSICEFDVIINDCEAPSITCTDDIDVLCGEEDLTAWFASIAATVTDNCDMLADLTVSQSIQTDFSSCGNTIDQIYIFTVEDQAGNTNSCTARYTSNDAVAPVITDAVSESYECDGTDFSDNLTAWINDNGGATFTSDNCQPDVVWTNNFIGGLVNGCGSTGSVEVTFTATDACGNTATTSATFEIVDTSNPVITCPDDLNLVCADPSNSNLIEGWTLSVSATDACDDDVALSFTTSTTESCGLTEAVEYVFTATDDCGNSSNCTRVITIQDMTPPTIAIEATDLILECGDDMNAAAIATWETNNGTAQATDACSDEALVWSILSQPVTTTCGLATTTLYTFQVMDNCGNTSTTQASVIIEDNTPPVLTLPPDATLECGTMTGTILTDFIESASATDDCGSTTITSVVWNTISGCGVTNATTYLFTATDECGNSSTGLATHTIEDTGVPNITCPAMELELECGDPNNASMISAWLASATGADANSCNDFTISNNYPGGLPNPLECDGGAGIVVTFVIQDDCGNSSDCMSTITMNDTANPYFLNCPADLTVSIDSDVCDSRVVYPTPSAADECDDVPTVSLIDGIASGESFPLGTTTITFETVDECGNTARCEFDITVEDTDEPAIECPVNDVVNCTDAGVCTWLSTDQTDPIVADNCIGLTLTYDINFAGGTTSSGMNTVASNNEVFPIGTSTITYTLVDDSGNSSTCTFDVVINDCEQPEITCIDDLDVLCGEEDLVSWFDNIAATATDNCDMLADFSVTEMIQTDFSSCGNTIDQIYLFTVEDQAGNTNSCTARYKSNDAIPPVITDAVDLVIECSMDDNSDDLTAWLNNNGGATFTSDNCSSTVNWTNDYTTALSNGCASTGEVTVVFTATDECDNSSTTSAVFRIQDTTNPVITCPEDMTLECAGPLNDDVIINWLDRAEASDACDDDLNITNDYGTNFAEDCGTTGVHTVVFAVTDACTNGATCSATITIEDNTSPSIDVEAMDLILECSDMGNAAAITNWEMALGGAVATDACSDEALVWSIDSQNTSSGCGLNTTETYVFLVTDNCGNTNTTIASVILEDTTPPTLTLPADQIEECENIAVEVSDWILEASATDECGNVQIAAQLWNTISGCGNTNTEQYLFTATDDCGNQSTGFASYEIVDTEVPSIQCPVTLNLECSNPNNPAIISNWLNTAIISDEFDCNDVSLSNNYDGGLPAPLTCNSGAGKIVTFTVSDACGNSSTCNSTITMDDTVEPSFVNCPSDMTVNVDIDQCSSNIIYSTPVGFDNCDDTPDVSLMSGISSGQIFPIGTTTIVFEVEDDCENTATCEFDITVEDSDTPLIDCPSNDVVVCNDTGTCEWESDASVDPLTADNCTDYTLTYEVVGATSGTSLSSGQNTLNGDMFVFNLGVSTVQYTIEDTAGNTSNCTFQVDVRDCEDPEITCSNYTSDCNAEDLAAWNTTIAATATDNCNSNAELVMTSQLFTDISSCGNTLNQVYVFTITDQAGNSSQCSAYLTTTDTTDPSIEVMAADRITECTNENYATILIAWLADNGGARASDLCSEPVVWTNDFGGDLNESCGNVGSTTVVFTATDDCGNMSTTSADFVVEDNTAATISCPDDITIECGEPNNNVLISSWLSNSLAADNCGGVSTVNDYTSLPACGETTTVTFTVTGNCDGELVTCTADITVEDTQKPVIMNPPADLFVECDGADNVTDINLWLANNTANDMALGMMAIDNCESVTITSEEYMRTDDCGGTTTIAYKFTATDDCGNAISEIAQVHISDTTPPVLNIPTAIDVVECDGEVATVFGNWITSATSSDICGEPMINYVLLGQVESCNGTITTITSTYQFTATDACGNQTFGTDEFVIEDNVAPVITAPADLNLECGDNFGAAIVAWLAGYMVEEACQSYTVTNDFDGVIPDVCGGSEVVTWTVTDACGASSTSTASIIIEDDTTPPSIDYCPADITITTEFGQCDAVLNYSTPTASDCNAPVVITKTGGLDIGSMINAGDTETIEFTATDACGNTSICTFDVTVLDQQLPYITCPSNDVIKCNDTDQCTWTSDDDVSPIDFGDNCNDIVVTYELTGATTAMGTDDAAGEVFNLGTTTVCYTIADVNGNNAVTCCFDVVINDCENPEFTCEDNIDVACGSEDLNAWFATIEASATDNCMGDLTLDVLPLTDFSSCGNTFERSYLFTVTDDAGNSSTCNATYSTIDNIAPTMDVEAENLIIECDGSSQSVFLTAWLNANGGAQASDACSEPIVWTNNFTGSLTNICGGTSEVDVIFTATDMCGNASTTMATFRIEDTTPPILNLPDDLTLSCNDPLNSFLTTVWLNGATSTDNCQPIVTVVNDFPGVITDLCGETASHLITFTATDACNNVTSDTRLVTFEDNTPPTVTNPASNLRLECAGDFQDDIDLWLMNNGGATALDDCSDEALVWSYVELSSVITCGTAGTTEYEFTVEDNCGNTSTSRASIIVEDNTPPEINLPEDAAEECGNESQTVAEWMSLITTSDACGDVTLTNLLWSEQDGCGNTFIERYLFTATDDCGNSSTAFGEYRTVDTTSPIVTCPENLVLECGQDDNFAILSSWLSSGTATDPFDCSAVTVAAINPAGLPDLSCDGTDFVSVVFIATDECNNTSSCTSNIFVNDTTDPEFVNCPDDLTVNVDVDLCGANPIYSSPVAIDNCEVDVERTAGPASGTQFVVGDNPITFVATDDCGNQATCDFIITVIDSDIPMILCPSNMVVAETDPGVCVWTSDDKVNPTVSFENCPGFTVEYVITGATSATGTDNAEGEIFNLGDSEVCYTITDASNNTSTCCFTVTVEDKELPMIECPTDTLIVATTEVNGVCLGAFTWNHPEPTDNCGIDFMDLNIEFPDRTTDDLSDVTLGGSETYQFPAGFNILTYEVWDVNGNSATCEFEVEILGIKHEKTIASVTQNPDDSYCIEYNIRVWNTGNNVGFYTLDDVPAFDDDFNVLSAEYYSTLDFNTVLTTPIPNDGWNLASNRPLIGYQQHNYVVTVCVLMDLKDPNTPGDGLYTLCDDDEDGDLETGEGLYNETFLDANSDGNIDMRDTVCADIPYITHEKDFVGYVENDDCTYDATFKITVANIGGEPGKYDLWDQPFFEDDFVINNATFTTDAAAHAANPGPVALSGTGPWTLADDEGLVDGDTVCYFLTVNVSINLSDPASEGDEIYTWCGSSDGSPDLQGQGLYNESYLDRSNDGHPEEVEETCGDIEIVDLALRKTVVTPEPYRYGDIIEFNIEIFNQGNIDIQNIQINDYLPAGYNFIGIPNDLNWSQSAPGLLVYDDISQPLAPNSSVSIPLNLELVQTMGGYKDWENYSEIGYFEDTDGNDRSDDDVDSVTDNDNTNDNVVCQDDPDDNNIYGSGPLKGGDEDDHDPAGISVFDLALRKTLDQQNSTIAYGGSVRFNIEIFNQGNEEAKDICVSDYLPCGLALDENSMVNSSNGWVLDLSNNQVKTVLSQVLIPGESTSVDIDLIIQDCYQADAWDNYAEISAADDNDPVTTNLPDDIDSNMDNDPSNDTGGTPEVGGEDDEIYNRGNVDEDDHDPERVPIFDLALRKNVDSPGPYVPGSNATFRINVYNQGNIPASNILVYDYLNSGFLFDPSINPGWTNNSGTLEYTINSTLQPADSIQVPLVLEVFIDSDPTFDDWWNYAEIGGASDAPDDIDSNPGSDTPFEREVIPCGPDDNNICGHGNNCPTCPIQPQDEDDHDPEKILVVGKVSGLVWKDLNGNGIQDNGEPGVEGVVVSLFECNGGFVDSQVTDSDGKYEFDQIIPGEYRLEFDISGVDDNCAFTLQDAGLDSIDSDVDQDGGIGCFTVNAGDNIQNISAGLIPLASIGNYVWSDLNGDGVQDSNEPPIEGVTVELYDQNGVLVSTMVTNSSGFYCFEKVYPGNYYLRFETPSSLGITTPNAGGNDALDSDIDGSNGPGTTAYTTLSAGENDKTWDAGFYNCVKIGELVWFDLNENDLADTNENGINGLRIELYRLENGSWALHDFATSGHKPGTPSDDGYFKFCTAPGTYYLKFLHPPATLVPVVPNFGIIESIDSDVTGKFGPGTTDEFTLESGQDKCDIGAGYYTMGTIGSRVWEDRNSNGMREINEPGIAGIVVRAFDLNGNELGSETTDGQGEYLLDYLGKNSYYLKFDTPQGLGATTPNVGNDEAMDSDVDNSNGYMTTKVYNLMPGQHIPNVDAGIVYSVLSVEWLNFWGENRGAHNFLEWQVSDDLDVSHYEIERSLESADNFEFLAKELSLQRENAITYNFEDFDIEAASVFYYRIKEVNIDGSYEYSKIISISREENDLSIDVYPNPVVDELTLDLSSDKFVSELKVDIYNAQGQLMQNNAVIDLDVPKGRKLYKLAVSKYPPGVYTLNINMDGFESTKKVLVVGQ